MGGGFGPNIKEVLRRAAKARGVTVEELLKSEFNADVDRSKGIEPTSKPKKIKDEENIGRMIVKKRKKLSKS